MAMKARYTVMDGEILSQTRSGTRHHYVPDPLGSMVALYDTSQAKTDTFSYWPYGEEKSASGNTQTDFRFIGSIGYFRDSDTRTYIRARFLDRAKCSFLSADPIRFGGGSPNFYHYVGNNPLTWVDFYGLQRRGSPAWCAQKWADMMHCLSELRKEFNKYLPWVDIIGGFPKKGGGVTVPGGHYKDMLGLQRCIANNWTAYIMYCGQPPNGPTPPPKECMILIPPPGTTWGTGWLPIIQHPPQSPGYSPFPITTPEPPKEAIGWIIVGFVIWVISKGRIRLAPA